MAGNVINRSFFTCGVEYVRCNSVGYVVARRAITAAGWGAGGGMLFSEGLRSFSRKRKLLKLLRVRVSKK